MKLSGLAMGGEAVGLLDDLVVFVQYGCPGDEIEVQLGKIKKSYARGDINRILTPSPHRTDPPCPIYFKCGGCQLQHMTYAAQLIYKRRMVEEVLHHLGGIRDIRVSDVLEAPNPWNYRNKMQVVAAAKPFLHSERMSPFFGLYARQTHQVIKMDECAIQHPLSNQVLKVAKEAVSKLRWEIYNEKTHKGMLRYLVTRVSIAKNEIMLILVVTTDKVPGISEFIPMMTRKVPQLKGIILNKNDKRTNTVLSANSRCIWGKDYLVEEISGIKYRISPRSFFQVNPPQVAKMFSVLEDLLKPQDKDVILDAYCGVGAISLWLADKVKTVIGIEEVPQAKKDALASADMNDIKNIEFHVGLVEKVLPQLYHRGCHVDKLVMDPPRKGCDESVLKLIARMRIGTVVYVSCNPATLARDLSILKKHNYRVEQVIPVDMFPQTYHIECIAKLVYEPATPIRKSGARATEAQEEEKARAEAMTSTPEGKISMEEEVKHAPPKTSTKIKKAAVLEKKTVPSKKQSPPEEEKKSGGKSKKKSDSKKSKSKKSSSNKTRKKQKNKSKKK